MKLTNLHEANVVDFSKRREEKIKADDARSVEDASKALFNMKKHLVATINVSIDELVEAGMSEDKATAVVMTYLSDLVMGHDIS